MKTPRTFPLCTKTLIASVALAFALPALAQVTPLSVPSGGVGPLTFDALPTPALGWSSRPIIGGSAAPNDITTMDTAAKTNEASNISAQIATDTVNPNPTFDTSNQCFRWNSVAHYIESRPTGIAYGSLMLSLRNDSGADRSLVIIDYDFGTLFPTGSSQTEDTGLAGLRCYYSLTGAAGTWTHIPEFDGPTAGPMHVQLAPTSAWEVGANLYLLWTDDNAVTGTTGTSGVIEGPYFIDNLAVTFQVTPISIVTQPHNIAFEACRSSNLTVVATGTGPITHQWFKGGAAIAGATGATLNLNNAVPSDSATYWVVVTGPGANNSVESTHVTVTVNEDVTPPTVLSAVAPLLNRTNIIVTFSEPMDTNFALFANPIDGSAYHIVKSGTGDVPEDAIMATINAAHTVVTVSFATPRDPNTLYDFLIDPTVSDCRGNPLTGDNINGNGQIVVPLHYEIVVFPFDGPTWKYDDTATDYGLDWIDINFDDSTWLSGKGLLDGKTGTSANRTNFNGDNYINGQIIHTVLAINHPSGPYMTDRIPIYYFRTSFTFPLALSHIKAVNLYTYSDDYDVAYFNGNTTPVHTRAGLSVAPEFVGYSGGASVGDANLEGPFSIPLSALVDGVNHIAAKEFQQAVGSSDITFGYQLTAIVDAFPSSGPSLAISQDPGTGVVSLTWPAGSGAQLYEANSVDAAGGAWSLVAGAADGSYSFTPGATGQKFYTLRQ